MKRNRKIWVIVSLVMVIGAMWVSVGLADEEEAQRPHFVWNMEVDVKPEHMEAYMEARGADAKLCARHEFAFPFLTFVNDFRVYTCAIFGAFAQLDGFPEKMEAWNKKTNGQSEQLHKRMAKCVDTAGSWIAVYRPDLSYMPQEPSFVPDFSEPFYQVAVVYHIRADKYDEAEAVARKFKAFDEKKQRPVVYWVYERLSGEGVPAFVAVIQAKDKAAFVEQQKKDQENPDPEIAKLMAEGAAVLKKIVTMEGTFVPEASYVPEGTF